MKKLHASEEFKSLISCIVESFSASIGTIPAKGDKWGQQIQMTIPDGYTPVGIVGYRFSGSYYSYLSFSELYISENTIHYSMSNSNSNHAAENIWISINVLLQRT